MLSKVSLQVFSEGYLVALTDDEVDDSSVSESQYAGDEYRFSGFLDIATTLDGSGLTKHSMLTVAVRSGSVTVVGGSRTFTVTPGYPLHIPQGSSLGGVSYVVTPAAPGAYVEILAHLSNSADDSQKFLWLRADQGVTTNDSGLVTEWVDTRSNSLAPSPFQYSTYTTGPVQRNDDVLVEYPDGFNDQPAVKFRGQSAWNSLTSGYGHLKYSGTEFTNGAASANDWTICMVVRFYDTGAHQVIASAGYSDGVVAHTYGPFVGMEGGGSYYYGSSNSGGGFTQQYNNGSDEIFDKPIILVFRYYDSGNGMYTHVKGGYSYQSDAFTTQMKFTLPMRIGGTMCYGLLGSGTNLLQQAFSGHLADFQYHPRALSDAEILSYRATMAEKYGIDDSPSFTFPFLSSAFEFFKSNRGLVYSSLTNDMTQIFDTRRAKASNPPLVRTSAEGTVYRDEFNGIQCVTMTGDTSTMLSGSAASEYAPTNGSAAFATGLVFRHGGIDPAWPVGYKPVLWQTASDDTGQNGAIVFLEPLSPSQWKALFAFAAGPASTSPGVATPAAPSLFSSVLTQTGGTAKLRTEGAHKTVTFTPPSSTNPSSPLKIGGTCGLPSSDTGHGINGNFFEAWYQKSACTDDQLYAYEQYKNVRSPST